LIVTKATATHEDGYKTDTDLMEEVKLIEKLRLIEALFAGATTEGEKVAAERARNRILERLKQWEKEDPPVEYKFTMADMWSRKVFVALLRRYGIRPYRYSGQRYTTVMARVSKRFVDETLWPEFEQFSDTLERYLSDVTDRVVSQVIHQDSSEAEVVQKTKQLPLVSIDDEKSTTTNREQEQTKTSHQTDAHTNESTRKNKEKRKRKKKKRKHRK